MLQFRIMTCFALAIVCPFGNALAEDEEAEIARRNDSVVVELLSGQLLRAQSIEKDPKSDGRIVLSVSGERIRMQRSLDWNRVNRLAAPPEMLVDLTVPVSVRVVDAATLSRKTRQFDLSPGTERAANDLQQLRQSVRSIPPSPSLELPRGFYDIPMNAVVPLPQAVGVRSVDRCLPCSMNPVCWPYSIPYDPGVVVGVRDLNP